MIHASILVAALPSFSGSSTRPSSDFPVIVYRQAYAGREAPESLVAPFGGVHVRGAEPCDWVVARGLDFYVEHSAGRDLLHLDVDEPREAKRRQDWIGSREDRFLVREPCLSDPATIAKLESLLDATLAAHKSAFGLGFSLGDEVSLTAAGAPDDLCLSPSCRDAWKRYVHAPRSVRGPRLAEFEDLAHVSTDAALAALESGDRAPIGAWIARRDFEHGLVLDDLFHLADRARTAVPGAPIGLMGLSGETAFGNVPVERAMEFLDFVETYRTLDATELAFTLRSAKQRVYATVFPSLQAPDAWAWSATEHWLRGGDGLIVWCDRDLERAPKLAERLARAVATIRALRSRFPNYRPSPHGVALLHASNSIAFDWLCDAKPDGASWPNRRASWQAAHGTLETAERAWLELLEDCAVEPGVVPLSRVDAALVVRFPVLVACELSVLDAGDVERLAGYLRAGGRLIVQGSFGAIETSGAPPPESALARLKSVAAERVIDGPDRIRAELASRDDALVDEVAGELAVYGVERAPWRFVGASAKRRWLSSFERESDGSWTCAALPKFRGLGRESGLGAESPRPALEAVELSLEAPHGYSIEWITPSEGGASSRTIQAGDAAVFRLVPKP